jgi:hypothetical protein
MSHHCFQTQLNASYTLDQPHCAANRRMPDAGRTSHHTLRESFNTHVCCLACMPHQFHMYAHCLTVHAESQGRLNNADDKAPYSLGYHLSQVLQPDNGWKGKTVGVGRVSQPPARIQQWHASGHSSTNTMLCRQDHCCRTQPEDTHHNQLRQAPWDAGPQLGTYVTQRLQWWVQCYCTGVLHVGM